MGSKMKLEMNSFIAEVGGRFVWERYVGRVGEIAGKRVGGEGDACVGSGEG
jgi:hypothetical protein